MNTEGQKNKLNVYALICALLMLISCFLPWTEISVSASIMGYSSSYRQTASGFETGSGVIPFLLGLICAAMVLIRTRFLFIPGIINLIFAILAVTGTGKFSTHSSMAHAHGGVGMGVYILLISCIGYLLFTLYPIRHLIKAQQFNKKNEVTTLNVKNNSGVAEEQSDINSILESVSEPVLLPKPLDSGKKQVIDENSSSEPSTNSHLIDKTNNLSGFQKSLIIFGIIIGCFVLIFLWIENSNERSRQEKLKKEDVEKQRIEQVISEVNQAVSNHDYELALTSVNSVAWNLDNNQDFIVQYSTLRENLRVTITTLKHERDSLEQIQKTIAMEMAMREDSTMDSEIKHEEQQIIKVSYLAAVAANRTYLFDKPDINADRRATLTLGDKILIIAQKDEFLFCQAPQPDGILISGWVLFKDVEKN